MHLKCLLWLQLTTWFYKRQSIFFRPVKYSQLNISWNIRVSSSFIFPEIVVFYWIYTPWRKPNERRFFSLLYQSKRLNQMKKNDELASSIAKWTFSSSEKKRLHTLIILFESNSQYLILSSHVIWYVMIRCLTSIKQYSFNRLSK